MDAVTVVAPCVAIGRLSDLKRSPGPGYRHKAMVLTSSHVLQLPGIAATPGGVFRAACSTSTGHGATRALRRPLPIRTFSARAARRRTPGQRSRIPPSRHGTPLGCWRARNSRRSAQRLHKCVLLRVASRFAHAQPSDCPSPEVAAGKMTYTLTDCRQSRLALTAVCSFCAVHRHSDWFHAAACPDRRPLPGRQLGWRKYV
jgi:hypothetical protein